MATKTGSANGPYADSYTFYAQVSATLDDATSATTATMRVTCKVVSNQAEAGAGNLTGRVGVWDYQRGDYAWSSATATTSWLSAGGTITIVSNYSFTVTKGREAQDVWAYAEVRGVSGYHSGKVSRASYKFSKGLPAKASYQVTYDANGGTGAPSAQTKWHGESLTLSSDSPARSGYIFQGWATTKANADAGTVAAQPGATYTANAAQTYYAVWKAAYTSPRITALSAIRCASDGTESADGTAVKLSCTWAVDGTTTGKACLFQWLDGSTWESLGTVNLSGTSGTTTQTYTSVTFGASSTYQLSATVTDASSNSGNSATSTVTMPSGFFLVDLHKGGKGIAFGQSASASGQIQFAASLTPVFGDAATWRNALGASSGVWTAAMIPNLAASKIASGTLARARLEGTDWAYLVGSATATNYLRWRMYAGWVQVEANYASGAKVPVASSSAKVYATLDVGYRPDKTVSTCAYTSTNNIGCFWVNANGEVCANTRASSEQNTLYAFIAYPLP